MRRLWFFAICLGAGLPAYAAALWLCNPRHWLGVVADAVTA
jgi:hypothetical protein